jgi:hypothetical protein
MIRRLHAEAPAKCLKPPHGRKEFRRSGWFYPNNIAVVAPNDVARRTGHSGRGNAESAYFGASNNNKVTRPGSAK